MKRALERLRGVRLGRAGRVAVLSTVVAATGLAGFAQARRSTFEERSTLVDQRWAELQGELQLRMDLVAQLLHESRGAREVDLLTLLELSRARDRALAERPAIMIAPDVEAYQAVQEELTLRLARLQQQAARDPLLRASDPFQRLLTELRRNEQRIAVLEQQYNTAVRRRNAALQDVPGRITAGVYALQPSPGFRLFTAR